MSHKDLKKQWIKKNIIKLLLVCIFILVVFIVGALFENHLLIGANTILAFVTYVIARNEMLIFVEKNIDVRGEQKK